MISVLGTFQNGGVVLDEPANFPEGAHVRVILADEPVDICCDGRPTTPEGIAASIRGATAGQLVVQPICEGR